jgi:Rod binding domain-containing protein
MYWDFWADALTQRGGFGLWKSLYRQLSDLAGTKSESALLDEQL